VSDVKRRLGIPESDTSYDEEISEVIEEATSTIDAMLSGYVETPLEPVPDLIQHACANMAAGIFRRRRAPPGEEAVLYEVGMEEVRIYIDSVTGKRVTEA